jgi:hypothetical protein
MKIYDRLEIHLSDETTATKFVKVEDVLKFHRDREWRGISSECVDELFLALGIDRNKTFER